MKAGRKGQFHVQLWPFKPDFTCQQHDKKTGKTNSLRKPEKQESSEQEWERNLTFLCKFLNMFEEKTKNYEQMVGLILFPVYFFCGNFLF